MLSINQCQTCKNLYDKYQMHVFQLLGTQIAREYACDGGTIADIGTGPGHLSIELAKRAESHVLALDINPAMLELAKAAAKDADLLSRVTFVQGDVHALPWPDETADLVVSYTCLHHWVNPVKALSECYRILKPTGRLIIIDVRPVSAKTMSTFAQVIPEKEYLEIVEKAYQEAVSDDSAIAYAREAGISTAAIYSHEFTPEDIIDCLETGDLADIPETPTDNGEPTLWALKATKHNPNP